MLSKEKERILINLTKTKISELEQLAEKKGVTRNDIITMAIYSYLGREKHIESIEEEKLTRQRKEKK